MVESSQQERLQPCLLDRLTDDEPKKATERVGQAVLSPSELRQAVVRDLGHLLNTTNLAATQDLQRYPLVAQSVLNYGVPALAGRTISGLDTQALKLALEQAIRTFEPRILPNTLEVRVSTERADRGVGLRMEIEGDLWSQEVEGGLRLKASFDSQSGRFHIDGETS